MPMYETPPPSFGAQFQDKKVRLVHEWLRYVYFSAGVQGASGVNQA